MGKKSKRRGGTKKKREEEERLASADAILSQQAHDELSETPFRNLDEEYDLEFFVGDRVWYRRIDELNGTIEEDPNLFQRGIVVESDYERRYQGEGLVPAAAAAAAAAAGVAPPPLVTVLPMGADATDAKQFVPVRVFQPPRRNEYQDRWDNIRHDRMPETLRFGVGDRVVCHCGTGWETAVVSSLYDICRDAVYICKKEKPSGDDDLFILVESDNDDSIRKRADTPRFLADDPVVFASEMAFFPRTTHALPRFVEGRVVGVDRVFWGVYAVYCVLFEYEGNSSMCIISRDDDQHIRSTKPSTPRESFLDAIKQDCAYEYFEELVASHSLDMLPIQDLLLEKSLEHACYGSLLWLQEHAHLNLHRACSYGGERGLLARISRSTNAERFFRMCSALSFSSRGEREGKSLPLSLLEEVYGGDHEKATAGIVSMLQDLGEQHTPRLLALVCCPIAGFAWGLRCVSEEALLKLRDSFRTQGKHECSNLIDSLAGFNRNHTIAKSVFSRSEPGCSTTEDTVAAQLLNGIPGFRQGTGTAIARAKVVLRFCHRWAYHPGLHASRMPVVSIEHLCRCGKLDSLRLFVAADPDLVSESVSTSDSGLTIDGGEFLQPKGETRPSKKVCMRIVDATAHGRVTSHRLFLASRYSEISNSNNCYRLCLEEYFHDAETQLSFVDVLAKTLHQGKGDHYGTELIRYRLWLQKDDEELIARLRVLEFLLKEKRLDPPTALDVIRWRQCGVLRWLVDEKIVDLYSPAKLSVSEKDAKTLKVLAGHPIPDDTTLGELLCFCSIEFDDLQSLEWLVKEKGIAIHGLSLCGWNVAHACAFFGRAEITVWCGKLAWWGSNIVAVRCGRKPYDTAYAVHIAVQKGFIFIAGVLLKAGSPTSDTRDRDFIHYAKNLNSTAALEFARLLGKPLELEKHARELEKDVRELLRIHTEDGPPFEKTGQHLKQKQCIAFDRWVASGFRLSTVPGPLGVTFRALLHELCRSEHPDFIVWLYDAVLAGRPGTNWMFQCWWGSDFCRSGELLNAEALHALAMEEGDEKLTTWLSQEWASEIHAENPACKESLLAWLQNKFRHSEPVMARLGILRAKETRRNALMSLWEELDKFVRGLLLDGKEVQTIEPLFQDLRSIVAASSKAGCDETTSDFLVRLDGSINADAKLDRASCTVRKMLRFQSSFHFGAMPCLSVLQVLAVEGYDELLWWLVDKENALNLERYSDVANITAYMGRADIVRHLLQKKVGSRDKIVVLQAALWGAVEGGSQSVIDVLTGLAAQQQLVFPDDPFLTFKKDARPSRNEIDDLGQHSLVLAAVFGCLNGPSEEDSDSSILAQRMSVLKWFLRDPRYEALTFLQAATFLLEPQFEFISFRRVFGDGFHCFRRGFAFARYVIDDLGAEWWKDQSVSKITRHALERFSKIVKVELVQAGDKDALQKWLLYLVSIGYDIQGPFDLMEVNWTACAAMLSDVRSEQARRLSQFEVLKHQEPLSRVKQALQDDELSLDAQDKGGLLISHLAAAYNRVDVLSWLVDELEMPLEATDCQGRDVLMVAKACNATEATAWVSQRQAIATISRFCSSNFRRRKESIRYRDLVDAILVIQPWYRGKVVRRRHHRCLESRTQSSKAFRQLWKETIVICNEIAATSQHCRYDSWEALKEIQCDFLGLLDAEDDFVSERVKRQDTATERALLSECINAEEIGSECDDLDEESCDPERLPADDCMVSEQVYLTKDVLKWLRVADTKYKAFFRRQIQRLAAGERGRTLAKRLIGSQSHIYEAYLEQKAGHRILWTQSNDHGRLLVWYVVAHDDVSHFMKLIDNSEKRSSRQLTDAALVVYAEGDADIAANCIVPHPVQLDPRGNTPLKVFEVQSDEIERLADGNWMPQLYLTDEERRIVESVGTVLVLGRSGTGKTICISNRMEYDRRRFSSEPSFSQLFIARSQRLCSFVKASMEESMNSNFQTFDELVRSIERTLPNAEGSRRGLFHPDQKVDFQKFKREVHSSSDGVDALIVWSNIQSFIKGSIEALQQTDRVLSESAYMNLGKRRCRLPREQREVVYKTFIRYDCYMKQQNLWDDMDRMMGIVQRLESARSIKSPEFELVHRNKVYVDEVQDYTQAEIYIFFLLSGPGDLFLAGDPCQSIIEGVEFRFEEIRSVGFYVCGTERHDLIPQKPKTVNVNFRSHSGILQTAAAVLSCLFSAFPDSAKQLKEDRGLFSGPRPGVFPLGVSFQCLGEAISTGGGIVVLTHDFVAEPCKEALGGYPLVYGIREAKGLEFKSIVLVNFFSELPQALQKPWRDLMKGRTDAVNFSTQYPEVEGQLKLLYTALTRCMQRLFFAETKPSIAGDAFVQWLTTCSTTTATATTSGTTGMDPLRRPLLALGTKCSISDIAKIQQTPDEWRSAGFDNAIMAESGDSLEAAGGWMEKAIYCFQRAEDNELACKAHLFKSSVELRSVLLYSNKKGEDFDCSKVESKVAQLVKSLLIEHFVAEALKLCQALLPFLPPPTQEHLLEKIISQFKTDSME